MRPSASELWPSVAPDWILNGPDWLGSIGYDIYKSFIFDSRYQMYVTGLRNTLVLTFFALMIGIVLGVVISLIRVSWDKNHDEMKGAGKWVLAVLNAVSKVYITVIRGTPVVVQLMIMYFVIFASSRNKIFVGALSFGINSGAYVAEIIRGGIMSIDPGQMEAGRSLGLSYATTMKSVIIPQAFKNVLPALGNELITLLKETSIVTVIGLKDLTKGAMIIQGKTFQALVPYFAIAVIYLALVMILTWLLGILERRMRESDRR